MRVDEATLIQYSLGTLDPVDYDAVQQAIAQSPALQQELVSILDALQYVAHAEQPIKPGAGLRNKVLGSIQGDTRFYGFLQRFADLFDLDNTTSEKLLAKIDKITDQAWQSTPFPGVTIMKFPGGPSLASATCGIVQVQAGKLFPAHQHQADEKTLILQGFAIDDSGNELAAGDLFHFHKGSSHSFRIIGDETFVFAVVLFEKNKWLWMKTLVDWFKVKKSNH